MFRTSARLIVCIGLILSLATLTTSSVQRSSRPNASSHLTLMGFTLEKNTLTDVQNKLGTSNTGGCSEDVEASKMICYVSEGPGKTRVFFESGSAGGWSRLDGFKVVSGDFALTCRLTCKATTTFAGDVQTDGGLKLGLNQRELVALLGPPSKVKGDRLIFQWQSERSMTKAEVDKATKTSKTPIASPHWDVQDTIDVLLSESKVVEFEIHHTVTD